MGRRNVTKNSETTSSLDKLAVLMRRIGYLGGDRAHFALGRLLYHLSIAGEEQIPRDGPCLFSMNHVALAADAFVYLTIRRHRPDTHFFGWQTLRGANPLFRFLRRFGEGGFEARMLQAYKAHGLSAVELLRAYRIVETGGAVALAAEGEITWDGRLQYPLAPGTAWLALRTGAPVVPIVSIGGYDVQPRWRLDKVRLSGRISIRVGQPYRLSEAPLSRVTDDALAAANQRVWEAMRGLIQAGKVR